MIEQAYGAGTPMGGVIDAGPTPPRFLVSAAKDAGSRGLPGTDLQRLQIIKGWVDAGGNTFEKVYDVAGSPDGRGWVNEQSCALTGNGHAQLCTVWQDPDFDAGQDAFYYVRVLENPSCRWSTRQCMAAGVNPFAEDCAAQAEAMNAVLSDQGAIGKVYDRCCLDPAEQPFYSPVIQERAWSSPIWYRAHPEAWSGEKSQPSNQRQQ